MRVYPTDVLGFAAGVLWLYGAFTGSWRLLLAGLIAFVLVFALAYERDVAQQKKDGLR